MAGSFGNNLNGLRPDATWEQRGSSILDPTGIFQGWDMPPVESLPIDRSAGMIGGSPNWLADMQQQMNMGAQAAGKRQTPLLGDAAQYGGALIDPTQQAQFRDYQSQLSQQLMAQALGQGPSIAQGQLQKATDQNMAQAMALGQSQHAGMGGGGTLRAIGNQRAAVGQQMAQDAGTLRLQEQQGAQGLLGQVSGNARAQDIGLAGQQAALYQQAGLANMGAQNQFAMQNQQAKMAQQQMNDQAIQWYLGHGMGLQEAQQKAAIDMQRLIQETFQNQQAMKQKASQVEAGNRLGLLSSIGGIFATAAS